MKKSIKYSLIAGFILGLLPGFMYQLLNETNQKILIKPIPIVCGYWSKHGVLEIVRED